MRTHQTSIWLATTGSKQEVPVQVDYRHNKAIPGNKTDQYEPESMEIVAVRWLVNNEFIGVAIRLSDETEQSIVNEILESL